MLRPPPSYQLFRHRTASAPGGGACKRCAVRGCIAPVMGELTHNGNKMTCAEYTAIMGRAAPLTRPHSRAPCCLCEVHMRQVMQQLKGSTHDSLWSRYKWAVLPVAATALGAWEWWQGRNPIMAAAAQVLDGTGPKTSRGPTAAEALRQATPVPERMTLEAWREASPDDKMRAAVPPRTLALARTPNMAHPLLFDRQEHYKFVPHLDALYLGEVNPTTGLPHGMGTIWFTSDTHRYVQWGQFGGNAGQLLHAKRSWRASLGEEERWEVTTHVPPPRGKYDGLRSSTPPQGRFVVSPGQLGVPPPRGKYDGLQSPTLPQGQFFVPPDQTNVSPGQYRSKPDSSSEDIEVTDYGEVDIYPNKDSNAALGYVDERGQFVPY